MHRDPASWFDAWVDAASGPDGFWTTESPAAHFQTASGFGPELCHAVAALLSDRPDLRRVVEVGAGDGRLLTGLHHLRPDLRLVGVDLRSRPAGLSPGIGWCTDRWDVRTARWTAEAAPQILANLEPTLVLAVEWLDDLPCRLAAPAAGGWWELDVAGHPSTRLTQEDHQWIERWWPVGDRVEVGRTRDRAWSAMVGALTGVGGAALMVDYGHERASRPAAGSLASFRGGRSVAAVPAADRNLTAHVAVDAVQAAGERAGARTVLRARQSRALADLLPPPEGSTDPLQALAARSRRRALTDGAGWGAHWWLLQEIAPAAL
nr:SAM-dependent methyltransferase [uncultured Friedmanniella sp.]